MTVKIRLARLGCKNRPFFRLVAADDKSRRDGKQIEVLGFYDPLQGSSLLLLYLPHLFDNSTLTSEFDCISSGKEDANRVSLKFDRIKYEFFLFYHFNIPVCVYNLCI